MLEIFSDEVDVISLTPCIPFKDYSTFVVIPSSISLGDAPGYATFTYTLFGFISGKKDFGMINKLKTPAMAVTTIRALAHIGYFMK